MDLNNLLTQFLGQAAGGQQQAQQGVQSPQSGMGGVADLIPGNLTYKIPGGLTGGLAAGGVIGLLIGNKKARKTVGKLAGGAVGLGGAAILGALAFNAYKNWQGGAAAPAPNVPAQQPSAPTPELLEAPTQASFDPQSHDAKDGAPFQIAIIKAMIAASNADGHIDASEQKMIFEAVDKLNLGAEEKSFIFDTLRNPPSASDIAAYANGLEQASELYLASRLAIDPDHPQERAYLAELQSLLGLPAGFVAHLEAQIAEAAT